MLDSVFKFYRGSSDDPPMTRHAWTRYYSCFFIISREKGDVKYLGCIFKDIKANPEPFYVMTTDHNNPYVFYKTRGAAATHLLFQDL